MDRAQRFPVVIGTAGHIDHGKTTLVKALTGQDADRLPEEKARGITIDLGFAHMTLPSGQTLAFIDVPGHERFVRNMVAGVHGMDAVMLVVAADEGVMPQTSEHLAILRLLGVSLGLTVITKADMVDPDMLEVVREVVQETIQQSFLEKAPLVTVDAVTGRGLAELLRELERLSKRVKRRPETGAVRLPIDRVFSVKGFGTVVTGTLVSGRVTLDSRLELAPTATPVRVRGIQVHNHRVEQALSGQRVAINVAGVERTEVMRGQVLSTPGAVTGADIAVIALELLRESPAVESQTRVHVHAGTAESLARLYFFDRDRLEPGQKAFAEVRFESVMPVVRGDRLLIRSYSPVFTMGGGSIVEVGVHHRRRETGLLERLETLGRGDHTVVLRQVLERSREPLELSALAGQSGLHREEIEQSIANDPGMICLGERYFWTLGHLEDWYQQAARYIQRYVSDHRLKPGLPRDELRGRYASQWPLRIFQAVLEHSPWVMDREWIRLQGDLPPVGQDLQEQLETTYQALQKAGLRPPSRDDLQRQLGFPASLFDDIIEYLLLHERVLRLEDGVVMADSVFQEGRKKVEEAIRAQGARTTAELKEVLGLSRRYAVLFLELLDQRHVTRRTGDSRTLVD